MNYSDIFGGYMSQPFAQQGGGLLGRGLTNDMGMPGGIGGRLGMGMGMGGGMGGPFGGRAGFGGYGALSALFGGGMINNDMGMPGGIGGRLGMGGGNSRTAQMMNQYMGGLLSPRQSYMPPALQAPQRQMPQSYMPMQPHMPEFGVHYSAPTYGGV
jgi:hypothetical protein